MKTWLITQVSVEILLLAMITGHGYKAVDYGPSCYMYNITLVSIFFP